MAVEYVTKAALNSMAQSISKNFSFKSESIKKVEIKEAIPSDRTDPTDMSLVNCLILTYVDDKLVDKNGNTINHVVNVELGDLGSKIENWTAGTDYKVDNIVIYQQHLYKCITEPQTNNLVFDSTEWKLFGLNDREKDLLDSLEIEEIHDNVLDPSIVTGHKITFKNLDENGYPIKSELLQTKDLFSKFVDDTVSLTDPKAKEKLLSAQKILDLIAVATGTDMSLYAQRNELYYTHVTYTRCLSGDDGSKEVVSVITSADTQVLYDDVVLQIPDIVVGEFVTEGISYDNPLYLEKESDLFKEILSLFTINALKQDDTDPDLITGYDLLYRSKKLYSQADKELEDLDFSTLDLNLPTATNEEMAALYTTLYNKVFDPSYAGGATIEDPEMATLYETIYNRVFGTT